MSHYVVAVILHPHSGAVEDAAKESIRRSLAIYDEDERVEEYETSCSCVGSAARERARKVADAAVTKPDFEKVPDFDEAWGAWQFAHEKVAREAFTRDPENTEPDPNCGFYTGDRRDWWPAGAKPGDRYDDGSGCGGTGRIRTTYNPLSRWDWYEVGGRWRGMATSRNGEPGPSDFAPAADLAAALRAGVGRWMYAVVEPAPALSDGEREVGAAARWHAKGSMGWFGVDSSVKEKGAWRAEVLEVLDRHADRRVAYVDCHI